MITTLRSLVLAIALGGGLSFGWAGEPAKKLNTETLVQLQAALQSHIDRNGSRGGYPRLDLKSGQLQRLHPAAGHPMILRLGEHFVMCATFRDDTGKPVDMDFYLARTEKGFSVFQVESANRTPLDALVKAGVARMIE